MRFVGGFRREGLISSWNQQRPYSHMHDYIFANNTDAKFEDKDDINERSCYGDRLMPTIPIPKDVAVVDIFTMLDTAAYEEVSMSQFNAMPRPATLLVNKDVIASIRQVEKSR